MKKIRIKRSSIVGQWLRGSTLSQIGEEQGVSRQRVSALFKKEADELSSKYGLREWLVQVRGKHPFVSFANLDNGRLYAHLSKIYFGDTVVNGTAVITIAKKGITQQSIRTTIFEEIKGHGLPYPYISDKDTETDGVIGFWNLARFAEVAFREIFLVGEGEIIGMRRRSVLQNLCLLIEGGMTGEEAYRVLSRDEAYIITEKAKDLESLMTTLRLKSNSIYLLKNRRCKDELKKLAGLGAGRHA